MCFQRGWSQCLLANYILVITCHKIPSWLTFYWQVLHDLSFWRSKHATGMQVQPAVTATCICFWEISNCFINSLREMAYKHPPWEEMRRDTCVLLFGGDKGCCQKTRYQGNRQPWTEEVQTKGQLPASPRLHQCQKFLKASPKLLKRKAWWLDLESFEWEAQ